MKIIAMSGKFIPEKEQGEVVKTSKLPIEIKQALYNWLWYPHGFTAEWILEEYFRTQNPFGDEE